MKMWSAECSTESFDKAFQLLRETKESLANVGTMRKMLLKAVEQRRATRQKERFLSSFKIADAKLPRLMASEVQRLALRNLTSAMNVPYIRSRLQHFISAPAMAELIAWYEEHERNFRFDPSEPLDPQELKRVEQMIRTRQEEMLDRLRTGPAALEEQQKKIAMARIKMQKSVDVAWNELREARLKAGLQEDGSRG
jgi:DNA-binding helix-hairpin-helix protein with protein kinase domain